MPTELPPPPADSVPTLIMPIAVAVLVVVIIVFELIYYQLVVYFGNGDVGLMWRNWRDPLSPIIANGNYIYQSGFIGQPVFNCLTINSITLYYKLESMRFLSLIPILVQFLLIAILFTWPFSMPLIFAYYIFFYRQ